MRSDRVVSAFSQSLNLPYNQPLRDHLTEMFAEGKASAEALDAIPILAGRLSVEEQNAIARTFTEMGGVEMTPKLAAYIADEFEARGAHLDAWNREGASNDRQTKVSAVVSLILGTLGAGLSLLTGHPEFAMASGGGGVLAATLSTVYGFSRAGVIDANIAAYGRHS